MRALLLALTCVLALAAAIVAPTRSGAESGAGIKEFFGQFVGQGIAKNRDNLDFARTMRDLDTIIEPAGADSFTWSPRRPRNTNTWPPNGFAASVVCTSAASPSKPLRMSVWPATIHTRVPAGRPIMRGCAARPARHRSAGAGAAHRLRQASAPEAVLKSRAAAPRRVLTAGAVFYI